MNSHRPFTDDQLETAARQFCELTNQNPDEIVSNKYDMDGTVLSAACAKWKIAATEICRERLLNESIRFSVDT